MAILHVPFSEKEQARALGARWNKGLKCWVSPEDADPSAFSKWLNRPANEYPEGKPKIWLEVSFQDKETVKRLGAWWDAQTRRWFVPHWLDANLFAKWSAQKQNMFE
jgi:DNA topoisomerase-3